MPSQTLLDQTFDKWTPSTDTAVLTLGTQEPNSVVTRCAINAKGAEWGLKCPDNVGSIISQTTLTGGKERALDIVRGSGLRFNDCTFSAGVDRPPIKSRFSWAKTCDIGIKGGATDIQFSSCVMTDLLLGDHSIYDNVKGVGPKTTRIVLKNCQHPNGKGTPIILRVWNADLPMLVDTNAVALVYWDTVVRVYFWVAGKWLDSRLPAPTQ